MGDSRKLLTCYQHPKKKPVESRVAWAPLFFDSLPSGPPHRHEVWLQGRRLRCLHRHGVKIQPRDQEDPVSFVLAPALLERVQGLHFLSICPLSSLQVSIALTQPPGLLSCNVPSSRSFPWTFFPSEYICPVCQSLRAMLSIAVQLLPLLLSRRSQSGSEATMPLTQRGDTLSWQKS